MSFSFGAPSSAPAATGLTGFSFGANKPATPGFGLATPSQPSTGLFGATPATSAPAFGSSFGNGTSAFGATSTAPAFGSITTPAFGANTSAFDASTATPAFGTGTSAFGASAAPTFGATTTPAFGAAAAPFGATTTPSLGGLGTGGLNFGTGTSTAPGTGLNFGAAAATTASLGLGGFGFGAASTQNTGFGLLGGTSTSTTTNSLFGTKLGTTSVTGTQVSTSAPPNLGLGGVAPSGIGATNTTSDAKSEPPKQTKLPNEIATTMDTFVEFMKKQKSISSEVMRVSTKPLHKVSRDAEVTLGCALALSSEVHRARAHSRRLRAAAAAALAAAEAAATPGTELDGSAPPAYVKELIAELEQQLIAFRRQMEVADKQMQSSHKTLSEQELITGIRRMHECLVALAGRLQVVHSQVEAQKEQYLNLRKYILKDPTNVFDAPTPSTSLDQILRDAETNRKKMKTGSLTDLTHGSAVISDPMAALGNIQQLAGPTPFTHVGGAFSPFPHADLSGQSWQPQPQPSLSTSFNTSAIAPLAADSSGFQLQKPPGKRGKQ